MKQAQKGFTLIELMIVIAIIGILAAIAVPQYAQYTKRAKMAEVITAVAAAKTGVSVCVATKNDTAGCDGGVSTIPADVSVPYGSVHSVVTSNGEITATGTAEVDSMDFILTPNYVAGSGVLTWTASGACVTNNICDSF